MIHPIICLRGIPGPVRLVELSLFFLLLPFCYRIVFTGPSYGTVDRKIGLWCDRESNPTSWAGPLPSLELVPEGRAFGVRGS